MAEEKARGKIAAAVNINKRLLAPVPSTRP